MPGAFSKEMAKGDSRFKDFPKGHPLEASACAQGAQGAQGAQVWLREQQEGCGQPRDPLPALQPPPGSVIWVVWSREVPAHKKHSNCWGAGLR